MRLRPAAALLAFTLSVPTPVFAGEPADAWVQIRGGEESVTMSGHMTDIQRAREAQSCSEESLIWFRKGDDEYVIRDERVLAKIGEAFAGMKKLEQKMQKVQAAHQALQSRIEGLAEKVGEIGGRLGELGQELGALEHDDPDRPAIEAKMRKLQDELRKAQRPMRALMEATEPFRVEMSRLSTELQKLHPAAERKLGEIFDAAIADGTAERR